MPAPLPLVELRARIKVLEQSSGREHDVLPFGVPPIDEVLPGMGLRRGALHEMTGPRCGTAAMLFAAGIAARLPGRILWCRQRGTRDLFLPGLLGAGLDPDRVLCAEATDGTGVLQVVEEGLRHAGLACVVGELTRLPMIASRRLNLAAEGSGVTALALRRGVADQGCIGDDLPTAALTRWRVTHLPSPALPQGAAEPATPGRACWQLELTRCRGGEAASWIVEACDAQGRLALPAVLADRPARPAAAPHAGWRYADWRHAG